MASKKFNYDPYRALEKAEELSLEDVIVIGRTASGSLRVLSSLDADETIELIDEGREEVESLAGED